MNKLSKWFLYPSVFSMKYSWSAQITNGASPSFWYWFQDNDTFLHLKSIKKITSSRFELCFETWAGYIFSFLACETLRTIVTLFFSNFWQSSFSEGEFIIYQLYLFINDLIFVILSGCFPIYSWFDTTVTVYCKDLSYFSFIGFIVAFLRFIQSGESFHNQSRFAFI